ncbi:hypothetical protein MY4038_010179 [Beauveria bassiana]
MGEPTHHGGASEACLVTANIGSDTDDDSSSLQSSSTDSMSDVVVAGLQGSERDDSEADSDGGSQYEEDSLDDDESRSVDSDSTGSLADFIAPDWEMESGNEGEAAEDDDYENESTDENDEAGEAGDGDSGGDGDGGDDRPKRAYLPNCDAMARLEMIAYNLRRLARESEAETSQRAALHHDRSCYCRRRGRRTTRVPPPLRRASGPLVAPHLNAESDTSPLSPDRRQGRRHARNRPNEAIAGVNSQRQIYYHLLNRIT